MSKAFRQAAQDDLDAVYMMGFDVWADGNSAAKYLEGCRASPKYKAGTWYVLEQKNVLVSSLIVYRLGPARFGIGSIATPNHLRKMGYASDLISWMMYLRSKVVSNITCPLRTRLLLTAGGDTTANRRSTAKPKLIT